MSENHLTRECGADRSNQWPFGFTLRGVMVFVVGIAVGAVEAQLEHPRWGDAVLTCLSAWAVFGLTHQMADLRRASTKWGALSADERWGARLALGWRAAVVVLLVAYYCVRTLLAGKQVSLPETEPGPFNFEPAAALRSACLCLLLMLILWSIPRLRRPARRRSLIYWGVQPIAAVCGATLCLLLWWRSGWIHFLVTVACTGIEFAKPTRFAIPNFNIAVLYPAFVRQSLVDAALLGSSFALTWFLAAIWRHWWRRLFVLLCLGVNLVALSGYTAWLMAIGVRRVSPWMVEAFEVEPLHRWFTAAVVVAVVAAALAMRLASRSVPREHGSSLAWRANADGYYHEWRIWSVGCLLGGATGIAQEIFELARLTSGAWLLDETLGQPMVAMYAAVCLLAIRATRARTTRPADEGAELAAVSLTQFCVFFMANLVTLTCAVPALAILSMSLWLTRWYDLPGL